MIDDDIYDMSEEIAEYDEVAFTESELSALMKRADKLAEMSYLNRRLESAYYGLYMSLSALKDEILK